MARISRLVRGPPFSGAAVAFIGRRMATLLLLAFEVAPPLRTHATPPIRAISPADSKKWVRTGVKSIVEGLWRGPKGLPVSLIPRARPRCASRYSFVRGLSRISDCRLALTRDIGEL